MADSKFTLGTRNLGALRANLRQYGEAARERAKQVVDKVGQDQYELTYELCPVDTGHMRDSIGLVYTKGGLSYQVGWNENDFVGAKNIHTGELIKSFYPIFQEFGTRFHTGTPCLFPAREHFAPIFKAELAKALSPRARRRG